jgi:hypothetical protein
VPATDAQAIFRYEVSQPSELMTVARVGDVNADGFFDLGLGVDGDRTDTPGRAYVVYAPVGGTTFLRDAELIFEGRSRSGQFGIALAGLEDRDGDGRREFAIGAPDGGTTGGGELLVAWSSGWP